jgi:hypothetical protein
MRRGDFGWAMLAAVVWVGCGSTKEGPGPTSNAPPAPPTKTATTAAAKTETSTTTETTTATRAVVRRSHKIDASKWALAEDPKKMDPAIPPYDPLTAAGTANQIKAHFRGKDRKNAKISVVSSSAEKLDSIEALIKTLPKDDKMLHHKPKITTKSGDRVKEEKRVVRVAAWIYAIKYEDDQDWHLIVGTDPSKSKKTYFNCEVSGLPPTSAPDYQTLLSVRESLDRILGDDLPQPGSYTWYDEPIAVDIEGPLFYDVDHKPGAVGPSEAKPKTAWEIHPITSLTER